MTIGQVSAVDSLQISKYLEKKERVQTLKCTSFFVIFLWILFSQCKAFILFKMLKTIRDPNLISRCIMDFERFVKNNDTFAGLTQVHIWRDMKLQIINVFHISLICIPKWIIYVMDLMVNHDSKSFCYM